VLTHPVAPSNLSANNLTQTSLTLNWQDNSNNKTGFTFQSAENSSFTKNLVVFTVRPDVISYNDFGLKKNTPYHYWVLVYNLLNDGLGPSRGRLSSKLKHLNRLFELTFGGGDAPCS